MTPLHQRTYSPRSDGTVLEARAKLLPSIERVALPMGGSHEQGFSNKCAAAATWNVLETCDAWLDEPLPTVDALYRDGRAIAGMEAWERGSFVPYVMEAACRLLDGAAKWMLLPLDRKILRDWLAVEKTAIVYGMMWTGGHSAPALGRNSILFPSAESVAPGHAVAINGYEAARPYRSGFLWHRRRAAEVFSIENTHSNTRQRYYIQAAELPVFGLVAGVFVPPNY
jgi:hypothetical protein